MDAQTVNDFLFSEASESLLVELAQESEYWETVQSFIDERGEDHLDKLSFKQKQWLIKIKSGLVSEAKKSW